MRAHKIVVPLVLFALAFVGALLVMRQPGGGAPVSADTAAPASDVRAARLAGAFACGGKSGEFVGERAAPARRATLPCERARGGRGISDERNDTDGSDAEHDAEHDAVQLDAAHDAAQPGAEPAPVDAQLASATVDAATDMLKYSPSADDRVRALRSLAATGRDGLEVARVRSSLHLAATDDDPDVAARAQEEYEALVERDDR